MTIGRTTPELEREYDVARLMAEHPPRFEHFNKEALFGAATRGRAMEGSLRFTRWAPFALPARVGPLAVEARVVARAFGYGADAPESRRVSWYLNFADPSLFAFYGGGLFAQDEIQVAEHPALGSLRETLVAEGLPARTQDARGATPCLVAGSPRLCAVSTASSEANPRGLYGNWFWIASPASVVAAVRRIEPATASNIVAIAAPRPGFGEYDRETIEEILVTAYSGFRAAVLESARMKEKPEVVIHTGFWGCGAFGGNRVLMCLLQIVAASMAGASAIEFHMLAGAERSSVDEAIARAGELVTGEMATTELVTSVVELGLEWGESDGN